MGWNEWPLIVFTVLAQTAIGAFWVHAFVLLGNTASSEQRQKLARGSLVLWLLMAVAFAASTAHLGMPLRAINSLARVGSAPLSNEILTGGAFFALGGLGWLLSVTGKGSADQFGPTVAGMNAGPSSTSGSTDMPVPARAVMAPPRWRDR